MASLLYSDIVNLEGNAYSHSSIIPKCTYTDWLHSSIDSDSPRWDEWELSLSPACGPGYWASLGGQVCSPKKTPLIKAGLGPAISIHEVHVLIFATSPGTVSAVISRLLPADPSTGQVWTSVTTFFNLPMQQWSVFLALLRCFLEPPMLSFWNAMFSLLS